MSANKTEFEAFDVGVDTIVEIIKTKISNKVILERAEGIDLKNKEVLTKSGNLKYSQLISTIPMNIFLFLCGRADIAKSLECEKDRVEMKVGQLVQNDTKVDFKYVEFFGRYATWNHGIKTNELLKQL